MHFAGLALVNLGRLNPSHHLLLRDQVVDPLEQTKQAPHVSAPLVQNIVRIARLGKVDNLCRAVDLGVDGLGRDEVADVLLRLVLVQVKKFPKTRDLNARVVLGHHAHIVLNDSLAQVLPSLMRLGIAGLAELLIKDVGGAEVFAELLLNYWPSHELRNGEELQKLSLDRNLCVAGVFGNAVEKV